MNTTEKLRERFNSVNNRITKLQKSMALIELKGYKIGRKEALDDIDKILNKEYGSKHIKDKIKELRGKK